MQEVGTPDAKHSRLVLDVGPAVGQDSTAVDDVQAALVTADSIMLEVEIVGIDDLLKFRHAALIFFRLIGNLAYEYRISSSVLTLVEVLVAETA